MAGRPSEYKEVYCDLLIEHMKVGLSFEAFAGKIGVCKQTLYTWTGKHPEFLDAKKRGEAHSLLWWEQEGIDGMWSGKKFNPAVWYMNMKNRHGWSDKPEGQEDDKPIVIAYLPKSKRTPKGET